MIQEYEDEKCYMCNGRIATSDFVSHYIKHGEGEEGHRTFYHASCYPFAILSNRQKLRGEKPISTIDKAKPVNP